jgi:hypothetical protein
MHEIMKKIETFMTCGKIRHVCEKKRKEMKKIIKFW